MKQKIKILTFLVQRVNSSQYCFLMKHYVAVSCETTHATFEMVRRDEIKDMKRTVLKHISTELSTGNF
ncbi:MAG: hypothetical protein A3D67_01455 [Candidatus Lloydbacteria bacterium RIFCSPHIGHO2_02_FULL_51_22]|uniref:RNA silencing suppressor P21 C-terminal domain-containing protein n=1 Tax=Candidatus Lloydbacteria bacterium RIFCSPHIGHO2_02_FULL_51_22 TaxID=1798663 RepID=A0A1G2D5P3_9BACT|nr:MAG: hypothetical protein A3D67_01455 [Candidatus Lloydbacteria bacterium RIFCSPHIGHO2_02_FULL_51_22]